MTNEFAIKVLTELRGYGDKFANIGFDRKEALDIAIKALEQQQDKVIHNHPCENCYYNDGDVHAECVVCDKPLEQQPCEYEPFTIAEVSPEMRKLMEEWQQPCEDCIRELIREFDNKHPALFADYMREFNNHPISEIIEYMWDMHNLIEDIKYRLPN